MRPRALLHATTMCLLLAAATVWAVPTSLFKLLGRSQKAALAAKATLAASKSEQALQLLSAGKTEEALPVLEALINAKRSENTAESIALANQLEQQVKVLRAERTLQTTLQTLQRLEQKVGPAQALKQLPDPHLKLLHKIGSGLSRVSVVEGRVKRFSKGFEAGFRDPDRFLPEVELHRPKLLSEWLDAPQDKRIFVIGAAENKAEISEWAKSWKSDGHPVFFYEFCRDSSGILCRDEAVGAMARTSGVTFVYDTPAARDSKYVAVEVATARYLAGVDRRVFLIPSFKLPGSFYDKTGFAMYVANMPTPSSGKNRDGQKQRHLLRFVAR
jgi:hypothetical protein